MSVDLKDKAISVEVFRFFFDYLNSKKVSKETTINNHSLEENITLVPSDIGAISDVDGSVDLNHIKNQGTSNTGKFLAVDNDGSVVLKKASTYLYATLSADSWSGDTAPYQQSITVDGMEEEQNGNICISNSATTEQREAARNAALFIVSQSENTLTIAADGICPSVDIPVMITLLG